MAMNPKLLRPKAASPAAFPVPTDPNFGDVLLLMHFDGANGSTTFTDSSSNNFSLSAVGDAEIGTASSKFGGAAFSPQGGYLASASAVMPDSFGSDWTLEAWVWRPTGCPNSAIINLNQGPGTTGGLHLWIGEDQQVRWDDGTQEVATGGTVPDEQWSHVAAVRSSGVVKVYVEGTEVASASGTPVAGPYWIYIGAHGGPDFYSDMLIDDLRVTTIARYTSSFTPPGAPFPDQ